MEGTVYSLIPPLVAIVLCVILREAILSLFIAIFVGCLFLYSFQPHTAFFRAVDDVLLSAFVDEGHAVTMFFTILIGGVVEIFNRSPAAAILLGRIANLLQTPKRAGVTIWLSGMIFFIDDYANSLIIGNSYRALADRVRMSREKLAYLVDTTSAPITSIAIVSTWIGFEISLIQDALNTAGTAEYSAYGLFLTSIPYRFYPLLALVFVFLIAWMRKDFGPMYKVEKEAMKIPSSSEEEEYEEFYFTSWIARKHPWLALVPLAVLLGCAIGLLIYQGLSEADPFLTLLWASMAAAVVSFLLHTFLLFEPLLEIFERFIEGCKGMFVICMILLLAWGIGDICKRMDTGMYVASLLQDGFNPFLLPVLTFLFAAAISFATGTSFGTMSILIPITMPIALEMSQGNEDILFGAVGSVLGGAIFGDHCSPLSDTTILSSGASGCPVVEHVRTQLPYALTVAGVSCICLILMALNFLPVYFWLLVGLLAVYAILRFFGKTVEERY